MLGRLESGGARGVIYLEMQVRRELNGERDVNSATDMCMTLR